MAAPKKDIDRIALEVDYRAGMSFRLMSSTYGLSKARIGTLAEEMGWVRDLSGKIKAAANAKVDAAIVDAKVDGKRRKVTERDVVAANATMQADIRLEHRADVPKKRRLVDKIFAELEEQTDGKSLIEQMTLALGSADMECLAKAAAKVASLPARIKGVAELMAAYKTIIALERQVFGIDSGEEGPKDAAAASVTAAVQAIIDKVAPCSAAPEK